MPEFRFIPGMVITYDAGTYQVSGILLDYDATARAWRVLPMIAGLEPRWVMEEGIQERLTWFGHHGMKVKSRDGQRVYEIHHTDRYRDPTHLFTEDGTVVHVFNVEVVGEITSRPEVISIRSCFYCSKRFGEDLSWQEARYFENRIYCSHCIRRCSFCNEVNLRSEFLEHRGRIYCSECARESIRYCEDCSACVDIHRDNCYYVEGGVVCSYCGTNYHYCEWCDLYHDNDTCDCEHCCGQVAIHDYGYKPTPVFFSMGKVGEVQTIEPEPKELYFGIELEVDGNGNFEIVEKLESDCLYFKHDGSLDRGFEMVTHPLSWSWIQENERTISYWLTTLKEAGWRSYDAGTCGMHVHLTAEAFSTLHLYKFLKLFYEYPDFTFAVSRRARSSLYRWASLDRDKSKLVRCARDKKADDRAWESRYTAVNLEHRGTVEVRVFRGTLEPRSFIANLSFLKSAFDYTRDTSLRVISPGGWKAYASKRTKEYPYIDEVFSWIKEVK